MFKRNDCVRLAVEFNSGNGITLTIGSVGIVQQTIRSVSGYVVRFDAGITAFIHESNLVGC